MSATVEKILKEVRSLSSEDRKELWDRVAAEEANNLDEWEKQIERDSKAGKLDHLIHRLAIRDRTMCDAGTNFN